MVQRYSGMGSTWTMPREDGEYVKYEDYERMKQEFMDYMVIKEKQIANLERALGAGETRYD